MKQYTTFLLGSAICALFMTLLVQAKDQTAWATETLSAKISAIVPDQNLVIVRDSNGIPFDMDVTGKTHIVSGNQALNLQDLEQYHNKNVVVRFVPEARGDVALSIRVGTVTS
jgi:hypothetical protein